MEEAINNTKSGAIKLIAKKYNPLFYNKKLIELLNKVYPAQNFSKYSKYQLHKILNEIILKHYNGETLHKYKLFLQHYNKKNIAAFEIKVNGSRADFLSINGKSTSYEIKSELDNLNKLNKQISDYLEVFEYNYLILDEKHISKISKSLPDSIGILSYNNGKYIKYKAATLNNMISPKAQLELLTKKELCTQFLESNISQILEIYDANSINRRFKMALKERYKDRWLFIVNNHERILPIDIQFFFNTNISPDFIYR